MTVGRRDHDAERDAELRRLRDHLADTRASWVPKIAAKARKDKLGWHLGDKSGAAGESLLIYSDPHHRTHLDFNGDAWKGDDLDLIGVLSGLHAFPDIVKRAAELSGFALRREESGDGVAKANGHANGKAHRASADPRAGWPIIAPIPDDAPLPPKPKARVNERLEAIHSYRSVDDRVLFHIFRFRDAVTGKKRMQPWTLRRDPHASGMAWVPYAQPKPLALYNLPALNGAGAVILVEGEKVADAAAEIAPRGYAVVSIQGGSSKVAQQDFTPLKGCRVVGWPDNDEAGTKAMATALHGAAQAGAIVIGMVEVPADFPEAFDLADPWPEPAADPETRIRELIEGAKPINEPPEDGLGAEDAADAALEPIPPRAFLYGHQICRGVLSELIAPGATGKTALAYARCMAMATGRELLDDRVYHRCRVLIACFEDDRNEIKRRLAAIRLHYGIAPDDHRGWLFICAIGGKGWKLATLENGALVEGELKPRLITEIKRHKIDYVLLDPFVKTHAIPENDNTNLDAVASMLVDILQQYDVAGEILHHTRKGPTDAGNADIGRGGGAVKDVARLVSTLAKMSPDEARDLAVDDRERRFLMRYDDAKVNIAPPSTETKWYRLVSVKLGNGTALYPDGDFVQTVEVWKPKALFADLGNAVLNAALDRIDAGLANGQRYSKQKQAKERAAWRAVVEVAPEVSEERAQKIIETWISTGLLYVEPYFDPIRRKKNQPALRVNPTKRPGASYD